MHYPVNVFTGKVREYDGSRPSAIAKIQVDGELTLTDLGLAGDEQAEAKIHGGPERALCHYPREHYRHWIAEFPEQADLFVAPAFGENLSTEGLTEKNVYIGDIFRWGEALIQVTQPRSPCFKLNYHFAVSDMAQLMQNSGKTGWLYRVVAGGQVSSDAPLALVSRLSDVSVHEAGTIAWQMPFDDDQYRRLLSAAGLSVSWSRTMQKRRLSGKIEDNRHTGKAPEDARNVSRHEQGCHRGSAADQGEGDHNIAWRNQKPGWGSGNIGSRGEVRVISLILLNRADDGPHG